MCGIVGFYSRQDCSRFAQNLRMALQKLKHRGPDDFGFLVDTQKGIGLGHRRLSVIDLTEAGAQPMQSEDDNVAIVYNGEVYNYATLKKELVKKGYHFSSHTDTEVIINAYQEWDVACLDKFVGMFAFAIWNNRTKCLFLARDRIGIKPLYYYHNNQALVFASELKALMSFDGFPRQIDSEALSLYLHYQYIPAPRTIFKDTYKLLPGTFLIYDGKTLKCRRYWNPPEPIHDVGDTYGESQYLEKLKHLLTQSVSDRLISDVPLGALLSGGIDSSLVAALMQKVNSNPVRTFCIGFDDQKYNEAPWASKIAEHLGTDHTELYVTPEQALGVVPNLPDIYDEPFADSSAIPTYLVSQLTRSHVTVALSGDGGDEQFAGYVRYWIASAMSGRINRWPKIFRVAFSKLLANLPASWIEHCYLPCRDYLPRRMRVANFADKWQKFIILLKQNRLSELYRMTVCLWADSELPALMGRSLPRSRFEEFFEATSQWPAMARLMHVDQHTYLPDGMLTKIDRASMANSLEVRVPLLDHRVVEFTAQIPENLKYRHGDSKYILKKVLAKYVPLQLFERPKMGFGIPLAHWLRTSLKDRLCDYLSFERIKAEGLFDPEVVAQTVDAHLTGKRAGHHKLWALLMWQMWRERWLRS